MAAAEAWALDRGFRSVALSSHVSRAAAHAFYQTIGYQDIATARLFRKDLAGEEFGSVPVSRDKRTGRPAGQ